MKINEIKWGDDSAEKDPDLLKYFVDSDSLKRLQEKVKSITIGRKGSGKSALRKKLQEHFSTESKTYTINIAPKYTSIKNILNDKDIKQKYGEEIFFQHTWLRQILLDCLCKIGSESGGSFTGGSMEFARGIAEELRRSSKDLVENIADVLTKIKVKAGDLGELGLQLEKELRNIADVDALEFHVKKITEQGYRFVILADDLDLGWDNSKTANNLLLGLLAAASTLSALSENISCFIFFREDVYSLLISKTQHSDKYRNVERIRWTKDDLIKLLNKRINFNRQGRGELVLLDPFETVFPPSAGTSNTDNWLIERTLFRPRELIQFVRYYSEKVEGETPDAEVLKASELDYSSWKLDDLCSEYLNQYTGLHEIFAYWKTHFFRNKYHLKKEELLEMLLQIISEVTLNQPWFNAIVDKTDIEGFLKILYEIGFIGDFVQGGEGGSRTFYSYDERHEPLFTEVQIHPCFRKAVNTVDRIRRKGDKQTEGVKTDEDFTA